MSPEESSSATSISTHTPVRCPSRCGELLEAVVPRCVNLRGVTYELFGSWYETLGEVGLGEQLARIGSTLGRDAALGSGRR